VGKPGQDLCTAAKTATRHEANPAAANDYSHIADPNLRRRLALSEIDKVPFGLYHIRAVAVAGVGFFLDSYDILSINLITTLLGVVFWSGPSESAVNGFGGNNGVLPGSVNTALKTSTAAGIVIGQVLFGWLADVFGRRRMYGIELAIIVFATLNCALASASQSMSSTGLLVFWRVMMVSESSPLRSPSPALASAVQHGKVKVAQSLLRRADSRSCRASALAATILCQA
jgi:PHS family inorganic phosphate transporter-like MFS transporter